MQLLIVFLFESRRRLWRRPGRQRKDASDTKTRFFARCATTPSQGPPVTGARGSLLRPSSDPFPPIPIPIPIPTSTTATSLPRHVAASSPPSVSISTSSSTWLLAPQYQRSPTSTLSLQQCLSRVYAVRVVCLSCSFLLKKNGVYVQDQLASPRLASHRLALTGHPSPEPEAARLADPPDCTASAPPLPPPRAPPSHGLVFSPQGVLSKNKDLKKAFGTENQLEVCKIILDKGEMQARESEGGNGGARMGEVRKSRQILLRQSTVVSRTWYRFFVQTSEGRRECKGRGSGRAGSLEGVAEGGGLVAVLRHCCCGVVPHEKKNAYLF